MRPRLLLPLLLLLSLLPPPAPPSSLLRLLLPSPHTHTHTHTHSSHHHPHSLLEDWRDPTRALGCPLLEPLRGLAGPHARLGMPLWSLLEDWRDPTRALGCPSGASYRGLAGPSEAPHALGCRACGAHTHTRIHAYTHTHTVTHTHTYTHRHTHTQRHTIRTELCFRGTGCLPDTFSKAFNGTRGWSAGSPAHSHSPTPSLTYSLTRSPTVFAFPIDAENTHVGLSGPLKGWITHMCFLSIDRQRKNSGRASE